MKREKSKKFHDFTLAFFILLFYFLFSLRALRENFPKVFCALARGYFENI